VYVNEVQQSCVKCGLRNSRVPVSDSVALPLINIAFQLVTFICCFIEASLNALFLGGSHDMVSAQNLNLDVLELVFAHLATGNDLASVALVNRSFLAGVIPRLYETLLFRLSQAKRYPSASLRFIRLPQVVLTRSERSPHRLLQY